jgi:hypothetical protein
LTKEVADADKYQEAYTQLLEEVGALIERNSLAEDEAEKLSKFNAEILSHNNPAQRIMYVDRIRTELAETKQVRPFPSYLGRPISLPSRCSSRHYGTVMLPMLTMNS